jgi:hypothetical protein
MKAFFGFSFKQCNFNLKTLEIRTCTEDEEWFANLPELFATACHSITKLQMTIGGYNGDIFEHIRHLVHLEELNIKFLDMKSSTGQKVTLAGLKVLKLGNIASKALHIDAPKLRYATFDSS